MWQVLSIAGMTPVLKKWIHIGEKTSKTEEGWECGETDEWNEGKCSLTLVLFTLKLNGNN